MATFSIPSVVVNELHPMLLDVLTEERTKKNFQPSSFCETRTAQLSKYLKTHNLNAVVVSISGGVDSGCVLGLLKKTQDLASLDPDHPFNPANGGKIIPVAQPICSTPEIQNRAYEVAAAFGIDVITVDQTEVHHQLVNILEQQVRQLADIRCEVDFMSFEIIGVFLPPINRPDWRAERVFEVYVQELSAHSHRLLGGLTLRRSGGGHWQLG